MPSIQTIIKNLRQYKSANVFNPWNDFDEENDADQTAPKHRCDNLSAYLDQRLKSARWLFIAEAAGFRGAKFSGIAMTCERQLASENIPHPRTSNPELQLSRTDQQLGVLEPTAMIVKRALLKSSTDPRHVVLWNTFAWHPHQSGNALTNRTPKPNEVSAGLSILKQAIELFPKTRLIAIGKTSQRTLCETLNLNVPAVRHPANGGAVDFTNNVCKLLA